MITETVANAFHPTGRLEAALDELRSLIAAGFPDATFRVAPGEAADGLCLIATVDVEDRFEVFDLFADRLVDLQVDEELPVDVLVVRSPERVAAMLRDMPPVRRPRLNIEDVLATPIEEARSSVHRVASVG